MSFLLEKNLYIFILSSLLIVVSILGNHETPIKQLFYDFEFFKIINILLLNNDIFRPPDTSLRFSIFIISFGLLLSSFFIESRSNINSSKIFSQFIIFLVSIFFITLLITDDIYNISALILFISSVFYSIYYSKKRYQKNEIILLGAYILIFIYPFYNSLIHLSSLSELDNYLRFLFVIPIYVTLREIHIKLHHLLFIFWLSSSIAGLFSIYQYVLLNSPVTGFSSSTSVYASIILFFSLASLLSVSQFNNKRTRYFFILAFALGIIGWMLTGQRGLFLIIILFVLYLLFSKSKSIFIVEKKILGLTSIILLSFLFISPVFERITNTVDSTYNYLIDDSGHHWRHKDSIVPRISIWKASTIMIKENNLYGVGLNNFNANLEQQILQGNINPIRKSLKNKSAGMNHAHNQYLDIYAKTGVFGFITLLFFIFSHTKFFINGITSNKSDNNFVSLLGLLSICYFSIIMFFQTFLAHQQLILFMSFMLIILASIKSNIYLRSSKK